jgi:hypothetical protein
MPTSSCVPKVPIGSPFPSHPASGFLNVFDFYFFLLVGWVVGFGWVGWVVGFDFFGLWVLVFFGCGIWTNGLWDLEINPRRAFTPPELTFHLFPTLSRPYI